VLCSRCWRRLTPSARFCEHCGLETGKILRVRTLIGAGIIFISIWDLTFPSVNAKYIPDTLWSFLVADWAICAIFGTYLVWSAWKYRLELKANNAKG
jgi:hypothetical protein